MNAIYTILYLFYWFYIFKQVKNVCLFHCTQCSLTILNAPTRNSVHRPWWITILLCVPVHRLHKNFEVASTYNLRMPNLDLCYTWFFSYADNRHTHRHSDTHTDKPTTKNLQILMNTAPSIHTFRTVFFPFPNNFSLLSNKNEKKQGILFSGFYFIRFWKLLQF